MANKPLCSFTVGTGIALAVPVLAFLFFPLFSTVPIQYWFQEHFFNTLATIARFDCSGVMNLGTGQSVYDASFIATALVWGTKKLFSPDGTAFFIVYRFWIAAAGGLSLFLLNRLLDAMNLNLKPCARFFVFSFFIALYFRNAATGADVFLAVPAVFLQALAILKMLKTPSVRNAFWFAGSVLLAVLCRFDTLLFSAIAVFVFYFQFNGKEPVETKKTMLFLPAFFCLALVLAGYFSVMKAFFGQSLPATLSAWTQRQATAPWNMLFVLFIQPVVYFSKIPASFALVCFPTVLSGLTVYDSFPWRGEQKRTPQDTVFYALIWFPVIYIVLAAFMTYVALPEYAFYSLACGAPLSLAYALFKITDKMSDEKDQKQARLAWLVLGVLYAFVCLYAVSKPKSAAFQPLVKTVAAFLKTHDGVYGISAGAGYVAFETGKPVARLDGLAQDFKMREFLSSQSALIQAVRHYGIDYLIVENVKSDNGCYLLREPVQNHLGGTNKGMSGWLCGDPLLTERISAGSEIFIFKASDLK